MLQAQDMEYIAWASENIRIDGKLVEHVSFQSFVRKFGFTDKEAAMSVRAAVELIQTEQNAQGTSEIRL